MAFKPVGADENGQFPPRVQTALTATYALKTEVGTQNLDGGNATSTYSGTFNFDGGSAA